MADTFQWAGFTFPRRIVALPHGSKADRLQAARVGNACGPYYTSPEPLIGGTRGNYGFYLGECCQMRWKWVDDISGAGIRHSGWFCDKFGRETIRGIVVYLNHGRMLAGWSMGKSMRSFVDYDVFLDESDAAYCADSMAENAAELEREYQAEQEALREAEEEAEEAKQERIENRFQDAMANAL